MSLTSAGLEFAGYADLLCDRGGLASIREYTYHGLKKLMSVRIKSSMNIDANLDQRAAHLRLRLDTGFRYSGNSQFEYPSDGMSPSHATGV